MSRAYLAGPMRGYPRFNFDAFMDADRWLTENLFVEVINPARMDLDGGHLTEADLDSGVLPESFDLGETMERDLVALRACERVFVLPHWEKSVGARREIVEAQRLGLPVAALIGTGFDGWMVDRLWAPGDDLLVPEIMEMLPPPPASGEVRVTNEKTGGAKGQKPAQLGAVDPTALLQVATVAGFGSDKYARYNFTKGFEWSLSFDAMLRHALAFWGGQDLDPESGLPHMAHAAWHCLTLLTFLRVHPDFDDRFPV